MSVDKEQNKTDHKHKLTTKELCRLVVEKQIEIRHLKERIKNLNESYDPDGWMADNTRVCKKLEYRQKLMESYGRMDIDGCALYNCVMKVLSDGDNQK